MIATNIDKNRLHNLDIRRRYAAKQANIGVTQALAKWIANQITDLEGKDAKMLQKIGSELQGSYGATDYRYCGSHEAAFGVDWRLDDIEVLSDLVGGYYLRKMGYPMPATVNADTIYDTLGPYAYDVFAEAAGIVEDAADYVNENGVDL